METLLLTVAIVCASIGSVVGQNHRTIVGNVGTDQQYSPLLNGVDQFFATSTEPEPLLKFFRDTLGEKKAARNAKSIALQKNAGRSAWSSWRQ